MTPRAGFVRYALAGTFYRMAFVEWGDPAAPPVVCVHGLTRTGRDFDALAEALADRYRVLCPDLPGRGASDWLSGAALYQPPHYVVPLSHLLATLGSDVRWVGTSLGGIVGMIVAAMPGQPVSRLVLNDIGPFIPAAALARIHATMATQRDATPAGFATLAALEHHLRLIHAPFGALSDAQWAHLARHSARPLPDGRVALHYDPAITRTFQDGAPTDIDFWPLWDAQRATQRLPVLVIRGADSDLLLPETVARMRSTGAQAYIVAEAGHAPALMDPAQIAVVRSFLDAPAPA